ncbi:MAG: Fic family protein, partial [Gammaproteobacteria bacterium]
MPPKGLDSARLIVPVGEANAALARYDGLLQSLVNPDILLAPLAGQEAVLSSRIEGTQATVEEVLEHEAGQTYEADKEEDIREILNYGEALSLGREAIREQPVRLAMIRELHKRLMSSVRGEDKMPGEFRNVQNWIGKPGCTMEEASFVPPSPLQLRDHLQDWEVYLEYRDTDPLIQCAVIHAQFELLHPFQDGNGRIGRLLIPLFLCQANRLTEPMFYLSAYLERNRSEYYDRLQAISTEGAWVEWVVFFLQAITEQAQVNTDRVKRIHKLYEEMKTTVRKLTRSQHIIQL